jgi:hypothetical protein
MQEATSRRCGTNGEAGSRVQSRSVGVAGQVKGSRDEPNGRNVEAPALSLGQRQTHDVAIERELAHHRRWQLHRNDVGGKRRRGNSVFRQMRDELARRTWSQADQCFDRLVSTPRGGLDEARIDLLTPMPLWRRRDERRSHNDTRDDED